MMVYFAQDSAGRIKIGCSTDVKCRVRALRVTLLASTPGGFRTEKFVHRKFAHLWIEGEWFRPESELLDFIARPEVPDLELQRPPNSAAVVICVSAEERALFKQYAVGMGLAASHWARMTLLEAINDRQAEEAGQGT